MGQQRLNLSSNELLDFIPQTEKWKYIYPLSSRGENGAKFFVMENREKQYCINVDSVSKYDRRKKEFEYMQELYKKKRLVPEPIYFGLCRKANLIYTKLEWLSGISMGKVICSCNISDEYRYGNMIGSGLNKFHSCLYTNCDNRWSRLVANELYQFKEKADCDQVSSKCVDSASNYIDRYLPNLNERPRTIMIGDTQIEHIYLMYDQSIRFININNYNYGDPLFELAKTANRFRFISIPLAIGLLDGYLGLVYSLKFFQLLTFYSAFDLLRQIDLLSSGRSDFTIDEIKQICVDYDYFRSVIPAWYKPGQLIKTKKK